MAEESERFWDAITGRRYNFASRQQEVEVLRQLDLVQVQQCFVKYLSPKSSTRRKLVVQVVGRAHADQEWKAPQLAQGGQQVLDCSDFTANDFFDIM